MTPIKFTYWNGDPVYLIAEKITHFSRRGINTCIHISGTDTVFDVVEKLEEVSKMIKEVTK